MKYPQGAEDFEALADIMTDPADFRFLHGNNANALWREEVNILIEGEHLRRSENFEEIYRATEKYNGYKARVLESDEFRHDWKTLKRRFPEKLRGGRVLRSVDYGASSVYRPIWKPFRLSRFIEFQEVFDFFCWKWFLEGMDGEEPIVTKLSFEVTPFGTTIFIPGYWSFDSSRDIKWKELIEFHRSRGVKRQGEAFEPNRLQREKKEKIFLEAEKISHACGESGKAMIERCIRMANLPQNTDPAYVYRVLKQAKKKRSRTRTTPRKPQ